jgi:hypothetical protein
MMRVLVAIPWRPQPHREYAHDLTAQRYRELLPDADIIDVDTDHDTFCLAGCRNEAVRRAEQGGYRVVVLGDADTLAEQKPLLEAIDGALTSGKVHLPYTRYCSLGKGGTRQHLVGRPLADCDHVAIPYATSGVYVTTPVTWWACGGQDERLLGWGMEDVCWLVAHRALLGTEPVRHTGSVYALHHESAVKEGEQYDRNVALYQRYLEAGDSGDPDAVRAIISEGLTVRNQTKIVLAPDAGLRPISVNVE